MAEEFPLNLIDSGPGFIEPSHLWDLLLFNKSNTPWKLEVALTFLSKLVEFNTFFQLLIDKSVQCLQHLSGNEKNDLDILIELAALPLTILKIQILKPSVKEPALRHQ